MKLQRYNPVSHNPLQWDPEMDECDGGEYYRAADVDALLARIRKAVAAERVAVFREQNLRLSAPDHEVADTCRTTDDARASLNALLSGEG